MLPRLFIVLAALLFSTGGTAIKATSLTSWQTAGFRSGVAALALLALVPAARRGWSWRVLPVGLAYAATLVLFVHSTKLTTSANAIFLQSTAPLWLLLIGPLVLKEAVRRIDLIYSLALAGGMALFFVGSEAATATAPDPATGNIYALLSGLAYAITLSGLRWMASGPREGSALATVTAGNGLAFLICLPQSAPFQQWTPADTAVIAYLGVFQIGLAYWCLTRGMREVPAFESSTLLLIEPVANPVWTGMFQGERPSVLGLAGGAVILLSTLVKIYVSRPPRTIA